MARRYRKRRKFSKYIGRRFTGGNRRFIKKAFRRFTKSKGAMLRSAKTGYFQRQKFYKLKTTYWMPISNLVNQYIADVVIRGNGLDEPFAAPSAIANTYDWLSAPVWQLMQLYTRYHVYKSAIKVTGNWAQGTAHETSNRVCGVTPTALDAAQFSAFGTVGYTSGTVAPENIPNTKVWKGDAWLSQYAKPVRLYNKMAAKRIIKFSTGKEEDYVGTCTAAGSISSPDAVITNPPLQWYWHVYILDPSCPTAPVVNAIQMYAHITIYHWIRFFQPDDIIRNMNPS